MDEPDATKHEATQPAAGSSPPREARDAVAPMTGSKGTSLESDLQAHIGRHLRSVYDDVVREPIPEHFLRLLEDLETWQGPKK